MMNHAEESDRLLKESFKQAGLRNPGYDFTAKVMRQVSLQKSPTEKSHDWIFIVTTTSIVVSLGLVVVFYPGFFKGLFVMAGFDHLISYGLSILKSFVTSGLIAGQNTLTIAVVVFSSVTLLMIDKIVVTYRKFNSFLFLV